MKNPYLLTNYFKEILNKIDKLYLTDFILDDYKIFSYINLMVAPSFYNYFSFKKNNLNLDLYYGKYNQKMFYFMHNYLIKNNYPKYALLITYAYFAYLILKKENCDFNALENTLLKQNKETKYKIYKNYKKANFKYDLEEINFLDYLNRMTIKYPGNHSYYKNTSLNAYRYYHYFKTRVTTIKKIYLKILSKINKKDYLTELSSPKLENINYYDDAINKSVNLINELNQYLYFNKDKKLTELITKYLLS